MRGKDSSEAGDLVPLAVVFGLLALTLISSAVVSQRSSARINSASNSIIEKTAPSVEHLASVREGIHRLDVLLTEAVNEPGVPGSAVRPGIEDALDTLNAEFEQYAALPGLDGERRLADTLAQSLGAVRAAAERVLALEQGADVAGSRAALEEFRRAANGARTEALGVITFNAERGRDFAAEIQRLRSASAWIGYGLDVVFAALTIALAWTLRRSARRTRAVLEAYARSMEERSAEMEKFAGRVAHDIRNPMAAAMTGVELVIRRSTDEKAVGPANKARSALRRANQIIEGLLDFARSGAHPDLKARTEVAPALREMINDFQDDARDVGVELTVDALPAVRVHCQEGVYLSLTANLIRNALKYMGSGERREIHVSVERVDGRVKTSVRDTGPGIAPENLPSLFNAYFRVGARQTKVEGLGIGLATVKKLAEGHGGRVGVESTLGQGSTFWFVLPGEESSAPPPPPRVVDEDSAHTSK